MSDNAMNKASRTDWERLAQMQDADIDQSDMPVLNETFFERARAYVPRHMLENSVQLDADIAAWFKSHKKEYTSIINEVLRSYIAMQSK